MGTYQLLPTAGTTNSLNVTLGGDGRIFFGENGGEIGAYTHAGVRTDYLASSFTGPPVDNYAMCVGENGNIYWAGQTSVLANCDIWTFDTTGTQVTHVHNAVYGNNPSSMVAQGGYVWMCGMGGTTQNTLGQWAAGALVSNLSLSGYLKYVIASSNGNVWCINNTGTIFVVVPSTLATSNFTLAIPSGAIIYAMWTGTDGNVWVQDSSLNLYKISVSTFAVLATYTTPEQVSNASNGSDGKMYAPSQHGVYSITTAGVVTLDPIPSTGFPTSRNLGYGVFDNSGLLWIQDSSNDGIWTYSLVSTATANPIVMIC